jgi:sugar lactone lactonase YvrE
MTTEVAHALACRVGIPADMQFRQVGTISGRFTAALRALCVDSHDRLYAAGGLQVKVFDPDGSLLREGKVSKPASAIAVARDGSVWVGQAGQVETFDAAGKLLKGWRVPGCFGEITAIGFHGSDILVADAQDRSIRRFDRTGKLLGVIGKDNRTGGFLIPNGVLDFDIDAGGVIHAANPGKHRVERYTIDGALLGHIGRFDGVDAAGFSGCCNPTNVTLGSDGRVYTTEKAGARAKALDRNGALLGVIADSAFNPASKNMDIAVNSHGRVFVADTAALSILVFEPGSEAHA